MTSLIKYILSRNTLYYIISNLLVQVNQHFNNQHNRQLMAPKHDTDHDPSVDGKLATHENESIPSVAMQDQDYTDIMNELRVLVGSDRNTVQGFINDMVRNNTTPTSQLKASMPESTLHRISKIVMKEADRNKMMELIRSGKKIPENDVDILDPIDTSDLYGLINEGINKHYRRNIPQWVTNDMVGITNVPTTVHSNNEAT